MKYKLVRELTMEEALIALASGEVVMDGCDHLNTVADGEYYTRLRSEIGKGWGEPTWIDMPSPFYLMDLDR